MSATATLPASSQAPETAPLTWWGYLRMVPLLVVHLAAGLGLWVGADLRVWILCAVLYLVRMFGVTAGYHRYFSHRTFRLDRFSQFALAVLAQTSSQKGVLWWAAMHRRHHRLSDEPGDWHSPSRCGFWRAHLTWIYADPGYPDLSTVQDLARFRELRVLEFWWAVPPLLLAAACYWWAGLPGLLVGFCVSTVLVWHGTFLVNSLAHVWGSRRYETSDTSRNNFLVAVLTLGEGWHNNHHQHPARARQGERWWELDITWMILYCAERIGWVRHMRK